MPQKRCAVILFSPYMGGKKFSSPRTSLTAGPPYRWNTCLPWLDSWFHCRCTRMRRRGKPATQCASRRHWQCLSWRLGEPTYRRRPEKKDQGTEALAIDDQSAVGRRTWARRRPAVDQRGVSDDNDDVEIQWDHSLVRPLISSQRTCISYVTACYNTGLGLHCSSRYSNHTEGTAEVQKNKLRFLASQALSSIS